MVLLCLRGLHLMVVVPLYWRKRCQGGGSVCSGGGDGGGGRHQCCGRVGVGGHRWHVAGCGGCLRVVRAVIVGIVFS